MGLLKVDRKYFVWQWAYLVTAFNSIRLQSRHVFQCRKYSLFTALEFKSCYSPIAPRMSLLILRSICDGAPWPESEQKKPHQTKPFSPQKKEKKSRLSFFFVQLYHISLTPKNMTFWPNWYQLPFWKALLNQLMRPFTSSFKNSVVFRFCLDINRLSQEQRRIWFVYNSLCLHSFYRQ